MKNNLKLFWQGLWGILRGIGRWFVNFIGMGRETRFSRVLRAVVGTCFTLLVVLLTLVLTLAWAEKTYWKFTHRSLIFSNAYYDYDGCSQLSDNIAYFNYYNHQGYIADAEGHKLIKGVHWVSPPLGADSLVCFSNGKKRGYFNINTGELVVKPRYEHAWIFSEGLAAVCDGGKINFIDQTGKVVVRTGLPYDEHCDGYVFHGDYCLAAVKEGGKVGLIDKQGQWALRPEQDHIHPARDAWVVYGSEHSVVLSAQLDTLLSLPAKTRFCFAGKQITAYMPDHSLRTYDLEGNLLEDFCISDVNQLLYDTRDIQYISDVDGKVSEFDEITDVTCTPMIKQAVARCMSYEADRGWYGLLSPDGKVLTPPVYTEIRAIDEDLYLCFTSYEVAFVLNGKGERVK